MILLIGVICILLGILFVWRSHTLKKKKEEQKDFLVLIGSILFIWFYPGIALLLIGILCLLAVGMGWGF